MRIRIPPKRIRERFLIIYELEGCQNAVDYLTEYYGVRRMKIIFNGRKVCKSYIAYYLNNKAYFTKKGLGKRTVLHELYHHFVSTKGKAIATRMEEREANKYARDFIKTSKF